MPTSFLPSTLGVVKPRTSRVARDLESAIVRRGKSLFSRVEAHPPSFFDSSLWTGKLMGWAMRKPDFRARLLHFVDAFPSVATPEQMQRLIREYFGDDDAEIPSVLKIGAKSSGVLGKAGHAMLSKLIGKNIEAMARQFIIGENSKEAVKGMLKLRENGYAAVIDLLGEAVVSETEADEHQAVYLELLDQLAVPEFTPLNWETTQPIAQVSIKPSALYSQSNPMDFEGSVRGILSRLEPIAQEAAKLNVALCLDMESYAYKDITIEVFRRLRAWLPDYNHLGLVLQAYLRDTESDLRRLLAWMRKRELPSAIRLVKGAYWDSETVIAAQNGWVNRVWDRKPQTDANFERCARALLENADICYFACASHNLRSIAAVLENAADLGVDENRYEFQVLYGMAEPVRDAILAETNRVRLYAPFGELIPGMAYLVRRILENTANESFLRATFNDRVDSDALLEKPAKKLGEVPPLETEPLEGFTNAMTADFTQISQTEAMRSAIEGVRANDLGKNRLLWIGGREVEGGNGTQTSSNPNRTAEILGTFAVATKEQAQTAILEAKRSFPAWAAKSPVERAAILQCAAEICERRKFELAAWQVLEVGKPWNEATADVEEAIDFLNFYALEANSLGNQPTSVPGEANQLTYVPRGVTAVIAPWNFPLAISAGMISAALVTGNPVVYKPSSLSALVGYQLVEIFRDAGLPDGVFNYVPGSGDEIGNVLVESPDITTVAFTGSRETGLQIIERAAIVQTGQRHVKRVIAEMGGKNAIIIDDDADLDEAVPAVLQSAFGFQGQKCSACSRVIVLDSVHDKFVARLKEAAEGWKVGPAEDPGNRLGAVVSAKAKEKVNRYRQICAAEGVLEFESKIPNDEGHFVPMTIVSGIGPEDQLAREEVFGPILAVMRATDFGEAIELGNASDFALTGGVFSRTPSHLERAKVEFDVGNLYLNRGITGALVGRQPFGGAAMSGVGSKAGAADYLLQFVNPKAVTENTMRRGFAADT